jgi:hypothetical protein
MGLEILTTDSVWRHRTGRARSLLILSFEKN